MRSIVLSLILFCITQVQAQAPAPAQPTDKLITIGTIQYNPPFEVASTNNNFFGFDIDIMRQVCLNGKIQCQFKVFLFRELFNELTNGNIDLAIASVIISKEREQLFLLSHPYLPSSAQFFTRKNATINSLNDINNKIIATVDDPVLIKFLLSNYSQKNTIQSESYQTVEAALSDLQQGKIDVFFLDKKATDYWISNNNEQFKTVGKEIPIGFGYAIIANTTNKPLIDLVNASLNTMEKNGTYSNIYNNYFANIE
jgi:ABC-type amino acid transport substrate-binding protein